MAQCVLSPSGHYGNKAIQVYLNFTTKSWKILDKNSDIFFIFLLKT